MPGGHFELGLTLLVLLLPTLGHGGRTVFALFHRTYKPTPHKVEGLSRGDDGSIASWCGEEKGFFVSKRLGSLHHTNLNLVVAYGNVFPW